MAGTAELLVLVFLLTQAQAWLSCMTVSCGNLGENICAQVGDGDSISLRSTSCNEDFACKYSDVMTWYTGNVTLRNNILMCTEAPTITLGDSWKCANRQASKNLVSGTYPKTCLSEDDCGLLDGSKNLCVCSPRSTGASGYCKPDISSSFFEDYWTLCTQMSGTITDKYQGYYWYLRSQFAVYYDVADLPACSNVLWEFEQMEQVKLDIAGAVLLAAYGLILVS